ncbi:hypothetical protein OL239_17955 [Arthrobacter sp. ATA002]|uniref:hypothetical protein n=1 Tax=Arthrobacter sp. ATA002 TaxID=2991715 RepID=UPI0022A6EF15|nr:hypothetical protein [Arthrobacter sp. ATA002]WAP51627.1 hypothetical protein OL239_17955 [Arthrobacter sp. ATA002]
MENNFRSQPSAHEAAARLSELSGDRRALADGTRIPRVLLAAYGGVGAWWVAGAAAAAPGENYAPPSSGWLALVAVFIIAHLMNRETGIRFQSMGRSAALAMAAIPAVCLALFSVSLGMVALGAGWAVVLTSAAAFGAVAWLAGVAYRSALDRMRHA